MVGSFATPDVVGLGVVPPLLGVLLFAQAAKTSPPIAAIASATRNLDARIRLLLSRPTEPAVSFPVRAEI
jgi:hypothetical protein